MPRDPKGKPVEKEETEEVPESPMRYGWFGTLLIASGRLWKNHWKAVLPPFIFMMTALALIDLAVTQARPQDPTEAVDALTSLIQILGVPFVGAWIAARVAVVLDEREDRGTPHRSVGERLRPQRSHIAASAMLAGVLTFFIVLALQQLGLLIGLNLFLGPPLLIHAIAVEGLSFGDAWMRMKELMRGEAVRIIIYLVSISLGIGLAQIVVVGSILVGLTEVALGTAVELVVSLVVYVLVEALALAFMACVGMAGYLELKSRQEARTA